MTWPTSRFPTATEIFDRLVDLQARAGFSPLCSVANLPEVTDGGRTTNVMRIGRRPPGQTRAAVVVFTGGIHAREWAPPTALVNLIELLLTNAVAGTGISVGTSFSLTAAEVTDIIAKVDLFVAPLINPDGYDHSRTTDSTSPSATRDRRGWRKNRRAVTLPSKPAGCTSASGTGVDINRNFGVLWDFTTCYAGRGAGVQSSRCPDSDVFIGTAAFSEAETKNVRSLLANDPAFYVDVHMFGPTILHSWGIENNRAVTTATPVPTCATTPQRDGKLSPTHPSFTGWTEPINDTQVAAMAAVATLMSNATNAATGNAYPVQPGAMLQSISGAADDFAFFRSLGGTGTPTFAYTIECGTTFLPLFATELPGIQNEVHAALLALLKHAASTIPTTSTSGTSGSSSGSSPGGSSGSGNLGTEGGGRSSGPCFIATSVYGDAEHPKVRFLRSVRDGDLDRSRRARRVRRVVMRAYERTSPPVARYLDRRPRLRVATRWLVVEPAVAVIRGARALSRTLRTPSAQADALAAMLVVVLCALAAAGALGLVAALAALVG